MLIFNLFSMTRATLARSPSARTSFSMMLATITSSYGDRSSRLAAPTRSTSVATSENRAVICLSTEVAFAPAVSAIALEHSDAVASPLEAGQRP